MKKTVVLVDDDVDDLEFMRLALGEQTDGLEIVPFQVCSDAFQQLVSGAILPDVIFLDINMPGMKGDDCLRQLRTQRHLDHVKIAMLSTFMPQAQRSQLLGMGANFAFEKPAAYKDYREILSQILSHDF